MEVKPITINDFHKKYYPNLNKTEMSNKLGITSCAYSKITNGTISKNSVFFKKASDFIKSYGYYLILTDKTYAIELKLERKIRDLNNIIKQKDQEIEALNKQIIWYNNTNPELKRIYLILKEKFEKC